MKDIELDKEAEIIENLSDSHDHLKQTKSFLARGMRKIKTIKKMNDEYKETCERMLKKLDKMDKKLSGLIIDISFKMD